MAKERVKPIVLTDTETGVKYTLEFTRETVRYAESRGFDIANLDKYPMTLVPDLFAYSFRANHKWMTREKIDSILFDDLGGLSDGIIARLGELYAAPFESLVNTDKENGDEKNAKMTVEM